MNWWIYLKTKNRLEGYKSLKLWIQINLYVTISGVNVAELAVLLVVLRTARNVGKEVGFKAEFILQLSLAHLCQQEGSRHLEKGVISGQYICAIKTSIRAIQLHWKGTFFFFFF